MNTIVCYLNWKQQKEFGYNFAQSSPVCLFCGSFRICVRCRAISGKRDKETRETAKVIIFTATDKYKQGCVCSLGLRQVLGEGTTV